MSSQFDETVFLPFAASVNDTGDLYRLIEQVEGLQLFLFRDRPGSITQKAGEFLTSGLAGIFAELEFKGLEPTTDSQQSDFLNAVVDYLKKLPVLRIILAFDPTIAFVAKINMILSQLKGGKVVIDIFIDESICGGAVLEFGGKHFESTLSSQIDEVLGRAYADLHPTPGVGY